MHQMQDFNKRKKNSIRKALNNFFLKNKEKTRQKIYSYMPNVPAPTSPHFNKVTILIILLWLKQKNKTVRKKLKSVDFKKLNLQK